MNCLARQKMKIEVCKASDTKQLQGISMRLNADFRFLRTSVFMFKQEKKNPFHVKIRPRKQQITNENSKAIWRL